MGVKINRVGETVITNSGMKATIIEYRNSDDIDIEFEDGYIAYNKSYNHFKRGNVISRLTLENRLGQELTMKCGLKAKIIRYNGSNDIDVEFEDGYIARNQCYNHFKNREMGSKLELQTRVGRISTMKNGETVKIIKYNNAKDIDVKFDNGYILKGATYEQFKAKTLYSIYFPMIEGVGYIGEGKMHDENGKVKKSYISWTNMLKRAYCSEFKIKHPTYTNVSVDKEWHCYANFEKWYNENYYNVGDEKMELDKDILFKGNKIYSPETCIFAPRRINVLFVRCDAIRGDLPIGVKRNGKRYYAGWYEDGKSVITPTIYDTPEQAFQGYKEGKEKHIKRVADLYKDKIPQKLYDAMYRYEVEITD